MTGVSPLIPVGRLLTLREEFHNVATKPHESPAVKRRAEVLREVLDELIDRREKEFGANG